MAGPRNSIVSDPLPYLPPEINKQQTKKVEKSDWAKLGSSRKYKQVHDYLETRKEYWRHFLPGGEALAQVAIKDPERAGQWAGLASCIVGELDDLQMKIQRETIK